jgi:hypothetical protein
MKNITNIILILGLGFFFCIACEKGLEREARRQCIVAQDNCEKYGACEARYLEICNEQ